MSRPTYVQEVEVDRAVDEALARGDVAGAKRIIDTTPQHTHSHTADKVGKAFVDQGNFSAAESVARAHPQAYETSYDVVRNTLSQKGASAALKQAAELDSKGGVKAVEDKLVADGKLSEPVLPQFMRSTTFAHASDVHWAAFDKGL